jgi:hypothetical protein
MIRRTSVRTSSFGLAVAIAVASWSLLGAAAPAETPPTVNEYITRLADPDWATRDAATRALLRLGPPIREELVQARDAATDPEVVRRLHFVIENLTPPDDAIIVVSVRPDAPLQPGDVVTHFNGRAVRDMRTPQGLDIPTRALELRLWASDGPRTVRVPDARMLNTWTDYEPTTGPLIAALLHDYATGYAERAVDKLIELAAIPGGTERVPSAVRGLIRYTVGDDSELGDLLETGDVLVDPQPRAGATVWNTPSLLDTLVPVKAPFQIEWLLWQSSALRRGSFVVDPEPRIQRVLVPAGRHTEALARSASLWWHQLRNALNGRDPDLNHAGNMLAVTSWMCSELDLLSECARLIEPRSRVLRSARRGVTKWVRVRTEAWLPFLAGDPAAALELFYAPALRILEHPLKPDDPAVLTQNPEVAARIAFFLYQFPNDERVARTLTVVNHPHQSARTPYGWWMLFALRAGNFAAIQRDYAALAENLPAEHLPVVGRNLALLEYIAEQPRAEVFARARELALQASDPATRAAATAEIDTLQALALDQLDTAARTMAAARPSVGGRALATTLRFRQQLADRPADALSAAQRKPLLAVPADESATAWLVLTNDRQLIRYDTAADQFSPITPPTADWFPTPLTWPWFGHDPASGRAWIYDRRRVVEPADTPDALRLNLPTELIAAFDRDLTAHVETLATELGSRPTPGDPAEDSEFLRADIQAHAGYVADPDLPELSVLTPLPNDPRVLHAATRNGVSLLIDSTSGMAWTSKMLADRTGSADLKWLLPHAVPESPTPLLYCLTNAGLLELDLAADRVVRRALPGDTPHPPLIREVMPYVRRDPRFVYFARTPEDGGQVYRLDRERDAIEPTSITNLALPPDYDRQRPRSVLRARIDARLADFDVPPLAEFIAVADRETAAIGTE